MATKATDAHCGISPEVLGMEGSLPVVVLTGFLGSGKTTLLARFLRHPSTSNTAVIVNELGEVGLDHLLVHSPVDETVLLDNGCPLLHAARRLERHLAGACRPPRHGRNPAVRAGRHRDHRHRGPVPMVQTLVEDGDVRPFFRLDGVIGVLDALNGEQQLEHHFQSVKQIAVADRVLLTKPDLVNETTLNRLKERVGTLNPGVAVDVVMHGELDPARLLAMARGRTRAAGPTWNPGSASRPARRLPGPARRAACATTHRMRGITRITTTATPSAPSASAAQSASTRRA